ncbi:MAG TPA: carboxypeptidase-like regulatory domain-containing protein, partial [Balneolales bacterium]|nr:carboxypeptidase-like regulatory domain-containing protein [Balneolales bacterium]
MYLFKRHPLYLFIISIFLFISCSGKSEITIKGKILDSHGSVIPRSDVHWIKLGENSSTQHLKADPSGHFTIQITTPGYYRLQLSGVNHEMYETVLDLTSMHDVQLTAYLSSSLTNPNLDRAYAVGSFNQFSLNN